MFSEWLKRGCKEQQYLRSCKTRLYLPFSDGSAGFVLNEHCLSGTLHVCSICLSKGTWLHSVADYTRNMSTFCCHMLVPQLSPRKSFTSYNKSYKSPSRFNACIIKLLSPHQSALRSAGTVLNVASAVYTSQFNTYTSFSSQYVSECLSQG